jgi:hypothetical protein
MTLETLDEQLDRAAINADAGKEARAAHDEFKRLEAIIAKGRRVVLAYLPNTGQCCGIDFKELNEFLIESTPSENSGT